MIFLFDENFPANAWRPVSGLFKKHEFHVVGKSQGFDRGLPDIELFSRARDRKIDAIVTGDVKQLLGLDRINERTACRVANLHWIGIPAQPRARGRLRVHGQIGQLITSLAQIVPMLEEAENPQAFLLRRGPADTPLEDGYPQDLGTCVKIEM